MNQRSSGLLVSDTIEGLLLAKLAEGRSPRTVPLQRPSAPLDYVVLDDGLVLLKPAQPQGAHVQRSVVAVHDQLGQ